MPADTTGYPPEFAALLDTYNQEVTALMARLEAGKVTTAAWTKEMQGLLAKYSQAARMLGMGEVKLLPAEVDAVRAWLNEQFKYLDGFETVISSAGGEYDPAWLPRAQMYGASTVTEYWEGKTSGLPLPAMPGQGTQCLSNCRCTWDIQWIDKAKGDADCFWTLHPAEHCQTCETRAEMWNPVKIRQGNLEGDYETPATGPIPPRAPPPAKPRQPKKPAEPVPPTPRTSGMPVSNALQNTAKGKVAKAVDHTIKVIDGVHGDGNLPQIPVEQSSGTRMWGQYQYYPGINKSVDIRISSRGSHIDFTSAHEIGHFIDHRGIDPKSMGFASSNSSLMDKWEAAVKQSNSYQKLVDMRKNPDAYAVDVQLGPRSSAKISPDRNHIHYLLSTQELWARSYAQYISEKSGDTTLLQQLGEERSEKLYGYRQWETADFAPIRNAIDELFEGLGWLK